MVAFFAISRTIRSLKKAWAEFVQGGIPFLSQHAAGGFIDCYDATILVNENYPLVEIVEHLFQLLQSNHIHCSKKTLSGKYIFQADQRAKNVGSILEDCP